jgi:hypothetical protein
LCPNVFSSAILASKHLNPLFAFQEQLVKVSKLISLVVAAGGMAVALQANAAGNSHKYPVFVINPTPAKPTAAAGTKATDAPGAKPVEAAGAKAAEVPGAKPADAALAKPVEAQSAISSQVVSTPPPESTESKPLFTTRYGPLSEKGGIDIFPDFNRGNGRGK